MDPTEIAAYAKMREQLAWLNRRVWLGGVMLCENPRRLPLPPTWTASVWELPGAAIERGECREEKRMRFQADALSMADAVDLLVGSVKAAGPHTLDDVAEHPERGGDGS